MVEKNKINGEEKLSFNFWGIKLDYAGKSVVLILILTFIFILLAFMLLKSYAFPISGGTEITRRVLMKLFKKGTI